jgi:Bacterial PH domain
MLVWLGILFVEPDILRQTSIERRSVSIAITVGAVAFCDWWFSRRMGLTIDQRGITLRYGLRRKRVPWSKIQGFFWKRWYSPTSEWIWIKTDGGAPLRIPTIQRPPGGHIRSHFDLYLGSSNLRSSMGTKVDAMATLENALAASKSESSAL